MGLDKLFVSLFGVFGIASIYWFFLMRKENQVTVSDSVDIIVDGGYSPETIIIKKGRTTKINFLRKDPSTCLEEVVLGDFKTRRFLPLNKKVTVELKPTKEGEFPFSCGMNMYHGKIIIK
jgi:plastocyanin domain-containing protein